MLGTLHLSITNNRFSLSMIDHRRDDDDGNVIEVIHYHNRYVDAAAAIFWPRLISSLREKMDDY